MISCEFETVALAVDHAKQFGGWLFYRRADGHTFWYDAAKVTMTQILQQSDGTGLVGTWPETEMYARLYES